MQLPFVTKPVEKVRTVGSEAVGTIQIRSVGAMTTLETEYFEANKTNILLEVLKRTKAAMSRTGRKYTWDEVRDAMRSVSANRELTIPELERDAHELSEWWDKAIERNNAIATVAIMRNRIPGFEEMTIEQFEDDTIVPPGIRAKLVEFAINESNGWPNEKVETPVAAATEAVQEPTEAEAAK